MGEHLAERVVAHPPVQLHVEVADPHLAPHVDVVAVRLSEAGVELHEAVVAARPEDVRRGAERLTRKQQIEVHERAQRRVGVVAGRGGALEQQRRGAARLLEQRLDRGQLTLQRARAQRPDPGHVAQRAGLLLRQSQRAVCERLGRERAEAVVQHRRDEGLRVAGLGLAAFEEPDQQRDLVGVGERERLPAFQK